MTARQCSLNHASLQSQLQGTINPSCPDVASYKGVPYASLDQRWIRAKLRSNLDAEFDATQYGPKCPQPEGFNHTGDFGPVIPFPDCGSDEFACLNLNVTCPSDVKAGTPLPVMVWIHGGSLLFGANSDPIWEPSQLVQASIDAGKPIIVVSINYRLGPFGFLASDASISGDTQSSLGNFGFHDQYLALQWIQLHITGFGGDITKVTIAGESAGGCSVHAQVVYQEHIGEPKLFNRAIMQSGNLAVMGFWDRSRLNEVWEAAVTEAGIEGKGNDVLERFREVSAEDLMDLPSLQMDGYGVFLDDLFVSSPLAGPCGDFLPAITPVSIDALMHGDNADEGNIFRDTAKETAMGDLKKVATEVLGEEGCKLLMAAYGLEDWKNLAVDERADRLHRFPEDARFYLPSDELIAAWPGAAFYHLTAKSPCPGSLFPHDSFHTLDLLYLFGNFDKWLREDGKEDDLRLGREMRTAWTAFVHGEEPWQGAFSGTCATFGKNAVTTGRKEGVRGDDVERRRRVEVLHELGFASIVQIATRVFP